METADRIRQFSGRMYIALETYKKSGQPKVTSVEAIERNETIYFRTEVGKWKVKRIKKNPRVRLVPCNRRGMPNGIWVNGETHILQGKEHEQAMTLFKKDFGTAGDYLRRAAYRLFKGQSMSTYISITPLDRNADS
jgi:PPOX class probable F420-dependent enzyme